MLRNPRQDPQQPDPTLKLALIWLGSWKLNGFDLLISVSLRLSSQITFSSIHSSQAFFPTWSAISSSSLTVRPRFLFMCIPSNFSSCSPMPGCLWRGRSCFSSLLICREWLEEIYWPRNLLEESQPTWFPWGWAHPSKLYPDAVSNVCIGQQFHCVQLFPCLIFKSQIYKYTC